jgi:transposase
VGCRCQGVAASGPGLAVLHGSGMPAVCATPVTLAASDRHRLKKMAYGHKTPYRDRQRATIVLAAARGRSNNQIAFQTRMHLDTVRLWRGRFAAGGLEALADRKRSGRPTRFTPVQAAEVKALACQLPAETGAPLSRWSCPELAREAVARGIAESISASTVRRWPAADALKPWQHRSWIFIRDPAFRDRAMIHDNLLPIVERLLAGESAGDRLLRDARLAAGRARRLIADPRSADTGVREGPDFTTLVYQVCDTCAFGLVLEPVFVVTVEWPPSLAEVLCAAMGEALRNAVRHAGARCRVNVYVESTVERGEIMVRDHGLGFDPATVAPGGGITGTFGALLRHGAEWSMDSVPGRGTTVTFSWQPADGDRGFGTSARRDHRCGTCPIGQ